MNVGFLEALNYTLFDCFIFHDVDHIPLNYGNYYGCGGMPRHFISGVDRWKYKYVRMYRKYSGVRHVKIQINSEFYKLYANVHRACVERYS